MANRILEAMKRRLKDNPIINALRRKQKYRNDQATKLRNAIRLDAIKSAIKEGDYVFNEGDDLIYPQSIEYKNK